MSSSITTDCTCKISSDFDILRQTEVFSNAPAEVVKLFAYLAKHRSYEPGDRILVQGEQADSCYFVINGNIEITTSHKGSEVVVQRLQTNTYFGELALLARFTWFFSATAVSKTELLIIDRESFQKVLEKYPERRDRITEKIIQLRISRFENQTAYMLDRLISAGIDARDDNRPLII